MQIRLRPPEKRSAACALLLLSLLPLAGCGGSAPAKDSDDMRNAMQGKGVGPMPADVKAKMDAAMKAHGRGGNGAPAQTKQ